MKAPGRPSFPILSRWRIEMKSKNYLFAAVLIFTLGCAGCGAFEIGKLDSVTAIQTLRAGGHTVGGPGIFYRQDFGESRIWDIPTSRGRAFCVTVTNIGDPNIGLRRVESDGSLSQLMTVATSESKTYCAYSMRIAELVCLPFSKPSPGIPPIKPTPQCRAVWRVDELEL